MRARRAGDAALLVEAEGMADRLAAAIDPVRIPGVVDVIPGASTVLVVTEPGGVGLDELAGLIEALPLPPAGAGAAPAAEIPVVYDGADLAEVARLTGLTADEVIARHAAAEYTVGWMGFSPGFGYLTGLDPDLAVVPRLDEPRLRVPAGAVAIAGGLAAVYPTTSPGGWRLLGRTSAVLWNPDRNPPALFTPGLRVRFRSVDPSAMPGPDAAPAPSAPPASVPSPPAGVDSAGIEVVRPGVLATVQDLGRPGLGHLGVPHSGAADAASLRLANRLVGNPEGAAGLELTLGRAVFRFPAEAWVAVTGAVCPVTVGAAPASPAQPEPERASGSPTRSVEHGAAFRVTAGELVQVGAPASGLRSYVAVRGGVGVPPVLGSRSADLRSGLGPPPLRPGDRLPLGPPAEPPPEGMAAAAGHGDAGRAADARGTAPVRPAASEAATILVIPGPRDDWFAAGALDLLCGSDYTVTPASDRTGLRLDGPALPRARHDELPSEGLVTGALQVPPSGRPILLLADHPVTGGYPVIAVVATADIGLAAQLRPGGRLRFTLRKG
jgi:KipI family sensor histidine kinase inhibitor